MSQDVTQDHITEYVELVPLRADGIELHVPAEDHRPGWLIWLSRNALLLITFILPTAVAVLYYGLIAADRYTSEAQFVVRSQSRTSIDQIANAIPTATGTERASDEASAVHQFVRSRDAVDLLVRDADLRADRVYARRDARR